MIIEVNDGVRKARHKNLVIYDIDYLLKHLAREIYLLEGYRQQKEKADFNTDILDYLSREVRREGCE